MWARNLLFVSLIAGGAVALAGGLFPEKIPLPAAAQVSSEARPPDQESIVQKVDEYFTQEWTRSGARPAARAADLALARRLTLALAGRIPSLQEVRRFEADPASERLNPFLSHLLQDRGYADYFAERLARAYVGTEDGPFLVYRRRRFISWLSDEVMKNTPYNQLVRELIADEGLWTDKPATSFVT